MKKWLLIVALGIVLTGCGSQGTDSEIAISTEKQAVENKKSEEKELEKKVPEKKAPEFRTETFQIEDSLYQVKLLKNWESLPLEEGMLLKASNKEETEAFILSGMKKENFVSLAAFKELYITGMKGDDEAIKIESGTEKEESYQTKHYSGECYSFDLLENGVRGRMQNYFLETETDLLMIAIVSTKSFFTQNEEVIKEMLDSIEPATN